MTNDGGLPSEEQKPVRSLRKEKGYRAELGRSPQTMPRDHTEALSDGQEMREMEIVISLVLMAGTNCFGIAIGRGLRQ